MRLVVMLALIVPGLASNPLLAAPTDPRVLDQGTSVAPVPHGKVPTKEDQDLQSDIKAATTEAIRQAKKLARELR